MLLKRLGYIIQAVRKKSTSSLSIKEVILRQPVDQNLLIQGWVRSVRRHKKTCFLDVTDGSCFERLQVVLETGDKCVPSYGSSISIEGKLVKSPYEGQAIELQGHKWKVLGECPDDYPFCNRLKYSSEYVRRFPHLRAKTRSFGSVIRVRNAATCATHQYFQDNGFLFVHTPIITLNDCEGAGEVFQVQPYAKGGVKPNIIENHSDSSIAKTTTAREIVPLDIESDDEAEIPYSGSDHFFGSPAFLTVSAQLHLEAIACAVKRVYSFSPIFRAEISRSRQHASEFHMIEAELAFIDSIEDLTQLVEQFVKYILASMLEKCPEDVYSLLEKNMSTGKQYIDNILTKPFAHMSYTEAVKVLQSKSLNRNIKWGDDLNAEHKSCLIEHCGQLPVFVSMFPADSSAPFYMKEAGNGLVYNFDLFAPFGGEICGASLRESSEEVILKKLKATRTEDFLSWYVDLSRYGAVPHGGFGIGFDRLLQFLLGMPNIRDIILFPRRRNDCRC